MMKKDENLVSIEVNNELFQDLFEKAEKWNNRFTPGEVVESMLCDIYWGGVSF